MPDHFPPVETCSDLAIDGAAFARTRDGLRSVGKKFGGVLDAETTGGVDQRENEGDADAFSVLAFPSRELFRQAVEKLHIRATTVNDNGVAHALQNDSIQKQCCRSARSDLCL